MLSFQNAHKLVVYALLSIGVLQIATSLIANWHFGVFAYTADQFVTQASVLVSSFAIGGQLIALAFILEYLKRLLDQKTK